MSDAGTAAATATTAATTATTTAATTTAATAWYDGADQETVGYLQNKGWDKLDPKAAALASVKSYREAERHLHAPPDQLVRFPKDAADTENWTKLHTRLGVPADAKEYDFNGVKFADGSALDDDFVNTMREGLKAAAVSKDRATEIVSRVVKFMDKAEALSTAEQTAKLAAERDTLKINWGSNVQANLIVAQAAAARLGVKPEALQALENQIGYAATMEMFRNIGVRIGEDKFVGGTGPGQNGPMSREQAMSTMAEKQSDPAWTAKLFSNDATTRREFENLTRIIAG